VVDRGQEESSVSDPDPIRSVDPDPLIKGSGSVQIIMDPDPRGPKPYGSGTQEFTLGFSRLRLG
jgi:hypothetical protein